MTEAEWLVCTGSHLMLTYLREEMLHTAHCSKASDRKVRLLNIAICHLFWSYLPEASKAIISESEYLADGFAVVTPDELCRRANKAVPPFVGSGIEREAAKAVCYAVLPQEYFCAAATCRMIDPHDERPESIIRDIFGNPFQPVPSINPAWLHWNAATIPKLAEVIYGNRCFTNVPILADALEEAGCTSQEILNHCRQAGEHVKGCWVVDLVLGKE